MTSFEELVKKHRDLYEEGAPTTYDCMTAMMRIRLLNAERNRTKQEAIDMYMPREVGVMFNECRTSEDIKRMNWVARNYNITHADFVKIRDSFYQRLDATSESDKKIELMRRMDRYGITIASYQAHRELLMKEQNEQSETSCDKQIGGDHYSRLAIQPIRYITENKLGYCEGNVIKYVTRWKDKGGIEDLKKAIHYLELLIESNA